MKKPTKKKRTEPERMSPEEFDELDLDAQFDACLDGTAPTDAEYFKERAS